MTSSLEIDEELGPAIIVVPELDGAEQAVKQPAMSNRNENVLGINLNFILNEYTVISQLV